MLDPVEEERYYKIKQQCRELGVIPPVDVFIRAEVVDSRNRKIHDEVQRAHSWTRNFYNDLAANCLGGQGSMSAYAAGNLGCKSNNGAIVQAQADDYSNRFDIIGMHIGSSAQEFSINNWYVISILNSLINVVGFTVITPTYSNKVWTGGFWQRWNNNTGATVTVRESTLWTSDSAQNQQRTVERTILNPEAVVINGAQFTLTYTTTVDMSAID